MLVHTGHAEKGTVFDKQTTEFKLVYTPLEGLDKKMIEVYNTITQNMGAFT